MTARTMQSAAELCHSKGLAFTQLRRQVYELIAAEPRPVGAYELLDKLKTTRGNAAPVTVYRTLDFLLDAGLIHRIDALQAYTACEAEQPDHSGLLLVCNHCKAVTELEDPRLEQQIARATRHQAFHLADGLIEIRGLCAACAHSEPHS
ncbi:MAG: Fur family transcriptional regulator [Pseudomonadales bacterium]